MKKTIKTRIMPRGSPTWRIAAFMAAATLFYYLPSLLGLVGLASVAGFLGNLHNLYGFDFLAVVFFGPVIYAAYVAEVKGAVVTALLTMVVLYPYASFLNGYSLGLLQPAAFTIVLSAIGAVIAMLQKGDTERARRMDELQCLYDIGKTAHKKGSLNQYINAIVKTITRTLAPDGGTTVRITVHNQSFQSPGFAESADKLVEKLSIAGEALGSLEIHGHGSRTALAQQDTFIKTLASRIAGAVHEIELTRHLESYYEQLEAEVEKRTRDLEQAQEKLIRTERLAAVGELASGVGHELRNPLNVIRNCVYLLNMTLEGQDDTETKKTLKLLDQQVDISNKIVTDLLDFTRIRTPAPSPVALGDLLHDSLSWVMLPAEIEVISDDSEDGALINVDAEQIGRVFANIIGNAAQAMGQRGKLVISRGSRDNLAWTTFQDNGSGISPENIERIFEPLFTTKPKGIGLGLAISRRLVEQNGGAIKVTSTVGEGTTFTVTLPIAEIKGGNREPKSASAGSRR